MDSVTNKLLILAKAAQSQRLFPGCAWAVVSRNQPSQFGAVGHWRYDETSPAITHNSIWDVASLTKSIPTACLALKFIEEGKLKLTDKLIDRLPEFSADPLGKITLADLMQPKLAFPFRLSAQKQLTAVQLWQKIFSTPLIAQAESEAPIFTNGPSILLGKWLERVSGQSLSELAAEFFWSPLAMTDTTWLPSQREPSYQDRIVPTEIDAQRGGELRGTVHDESAWVLGEAVGAAGVFTSVVDLAKYASMLLNHGRTPAGRALFSPASRQLMTQGYGWEIQGDWLESAPGRFGKTGFTGCSITIDLEKNLSLILLTNAVHPYRPTDRIALNTWRRQMFQALIAQ